MNINTEGRQKNKWYGSAQSTFILRCLAAWATLMMFFMSSVTVSSCRSISHQQTLRRGSSSQVYTLGRDRVMIEARERILYYIALKGAGSDLSDEEIIAVYDLIFSNLSYHLPRSSCYILDKKDFRPPTLTPQQIARGTGMIEKTAFQTIELLLAPEDEGGELTRESVSESSGSARYSLNEPEFVYCRLSILLDINQEALFKAGHHRIFELFQPTA